MGQMLDLLTESRDNMTTKYTEEAYFRIVRYKTAFYSFYLPVACAMILGGYTDEKLFTLAESICCKMGKRTMLEGLVIAQGLVLDFAPR